MFFNLKTDHLDRHNQLTHYHRIKQTIYRDCQVAIWNREDVRTDLEYGVPEVVDFGIGSPTLTQGFSLMTQLDNTWLMQGETLLNRSEIVKNKYLSLLKRTRYVSKQYRSCPLSTSCTITSAYSVSQSATPDYIDSHPRAGITWMNDSKATNIVPSLIAAVSKASHCAVSDDTILLSPAYGRQDMFQDYIERGNCFKNTQVTIKFK